MRHSVTDFRETERSRDNERERERREREKEGKKNQSFKRRIHVTFVYGEGREVT